jgi:hypothetical protein
MANRRSPTSAAMIGGGDCSGRDVVGAFGSSFLDDGIGGAAAGKGPGLTGRVDRVEAPGGKMTIQSPARRGSSLLVNIPIETN